MATPRRAADQTAGTRRARRFAGLRHWGWATLVISVSALVTLHVTSWADTKPKRKGKNDDLVKLGASLLDDDPAAPPAAGSGTGTKPRTGGTKPATGGTKPAVGGTKPTGTAAGSGSVATPVGTAAGSGTTTAAGSAAPTTLPSTVGAVGAGSGAGSGAVAAGSAAMGSAGSGSAAGSAAPTPAMLDAGVPDASPLDAAPGLDAGLPPPVDPTAPTATPPPVAAAAVPAVGAPPAPDPRPATQRPRKGSSPKRNARIESGANVELQGPANSPLASLGIPPAAVPAVAAAATAAAMGFWPFLMKTLLGLLKAIGKGLVANWFKDRAKKGQKVRTDGKAYNVLGYAVRPREVIHLTLGALIYGLAVYYAMFGWSWERDAFARQEGLVFMFSVMRLLIRYVWEKAYGIVSEYRFWTGGGVLSLGSAFLGNALNTVGYELSTAATSLEKKRMFNLTVVMMFIMIGLSVAFFLANTAHPTTFLQAGVMATTGSCLSDILPTKPMNGEKIWKESKLLWLVLAAVILPMFFLFNFVL